MNTMTQNNWWHKRCHVFFFTTTTIATKTGREQKVENSLPEVTFPWFLCTFLQIIDFEHKFQAFILEWLFRIPIRRSLQLHDVYSHHTIMYRYVVEQQQPPEEESQCGGSVVKDERQQHLLF